MKKKALIELLNFLLILEELVDKTNNTKVITNAIAEVLLEYDEDIARNILPFIGLRTHYPKSPYITTGINRRTAKFLAKVNFTRDQMEGIAQHFDHISKYIVKTCDTPTIFNLEKVNTARDDHRVLRNYISPVKSGNEVKYMELTPLSYRLLRKASKLDTSDHYCIPNLVASLLMSLLNNSAGTYDEIAFYGIKPVDAGDVPSKASAGRLSQLGIITSVCLNNQDGYRALTNYGYLVTKRLEILISKPKDYNFDRPSLAVGDVCKT